MRPNRCHLRMILRGFAGLETTPRGRSPSLNSKKVLDLGNWASKLFTSVIPTQQLNKFDCLKIALILQVQVVEVVSIPNICSKATWDATNPYQPPMLSFLHSLRFVGRC